MICNTHTVQLYDDDVDDDDEDDDGVYVKVCWELKTD